MSLSRKLTLAGAALTFALGVAIAGRVSSLSPGFHQLAGSALVAELVLLTLALGGTWASQRAPGDALGLLPSRLPGHVIVMLVVATLAASHALDGVLSLLGLRGQSALDAFANALAGIHGLELMAALAAIGLMPALAEELLCRGIVQRSLALRVGPVFAILSSSLLFAILHGEVIHALLAAPLGLHLGLIAWWGDSTRPAMLCHAVNNLGAVLLAAMAFEMPGSPWFHVGLGSLVAGGCWLMAASLGPGPPGRSPLQPRPGTDDG